ncbi:hypothetical protein NDU88_004769 [Pleurodeles waltl]|uniref:Uncharacterized protein n=1 Tax=Pleurodeles waltl TaxID=8319 RepID=A0AAV7QFQ9_PLEWA|nr:hypothetical protein NDU88_004769 [Pleurodeles waltl]
MEGTDSRGTEHWVGTYQRRWTPWKRTGLQTRDRSRGRGWGEALQQGVAVGAGERAPAERSGFSHLRRAASAIKRGQQLGGGRRAGNGERMGTGGGGE